MFKLQKNLIVLSVWLNAEMLFSLNVGIYRFVRAVTKAIDRICLDVHYAEIKWAMMYYLYRN